MPSTLPHAIVVALLAALPVSAQDNPQSAQQPLADAPAAPVAKPAEGLLPLPDYTGDLAARQYLTGDWDGARTDLAKKGLTFDLNWTQVGQTVVSGGRRIDWDYGGLVDLVLRADLQRMGLLPGALITVRTESRYGESVNNDTGAILPVSTTGFFPLTSRANEGIPVTITELTYTQFLSPEFGVSLGKIQTLDGDLNEFASGRGRSQFMNLNFIINSAAALTVPYSTLGGAVIWLPTEKVKVTSAIFNTKDSSTTSGFDNVEDGWTWSSEASVQYRLGELPGGMNVGGSYAFAGDFAQLGGKLQLIPGSGVALPRNSESWSIYWSGWQYLYTPDKAPARIDTTDGRPDLRGVGLFARAGWGDQDTNPIEWNVSTGLGGRGLIPGRDADTLGVGYVYTTLQNSGPFAALLIEDATQGVETFYNIALTNAINLSLDAQWVKGGSLKVSEATVLGMRLNIRF